MLLEDGDHAYLSMLLAVNGLLAALHIEARVPPAGRLQAMLVEDVDHAYLSMLLAVKRLLATLHIEARFPRA